MTKKKPTFFIKSRLSPSLCFPSWAVFPAGWRKDMRVPGVLHRALHNKPSVENKMPQTRIILIKSWNQSCVEIWGRWVVNTGEMGSGLVKCREEPGERFWGYLRWDWGIPMAGLVFFCPQSIFPPFYGGILDKLCSDMEKFSLSGGGNIHFTHVEQIWQTQRLWPWDMTGKYLSYFNSKLNPKAGKMLAFKTNLL